MSFFASRFTPIDPRAPYEALDDLLALFKAEPLLKRLSFESHWRGWNDERPPSNPRMIFWVSAWVGKNDPQSPQGLAMAQTVERVLIDRGLMIEPEDGYNWNARNTLLSPWKRKDLVKAFAQEAKTPLTDPNRLALLRAQTMLEYLNGGRLEPENLDYRRTTLIERMDGLSGVPEVPVDPPNVPSAGVLHLRRKLHALRGDPAIERLDQRAQAGASAQAWTGDLADDERLALDEEAVAPVSRPVRRRP